MRDRIRIYHLHVYIGIDFNMKDPYIDVWLRPVLANRIQDHNHRPLLTLTNRRHMNNYDPHNDKNKPNHLRKNSARVPMTSRVDILALSNVARFLMLEEGERHVTRSELINQIVKAMSRMLIVDGKVQESENMEEALHQLKLLGMDFSGNKQVQKEIHNKLSYEERVRGSINISGSPYKKNHKTREQEMSEMKKEAKRLQETGEWKKYAKELGYKEEDNTQTDAEKSFAKRKAGIDDTPIAPRVPDHMRADIDDEDEDG